MLQPRTYVVELWQRCVTDYDKYTCLVGNEPGAVWSHQSRRSRTEFPALMDGYDGYDGYDYEKQTNIKHWN